MIYFADFIESLLLTLSPKCQIGDLARNNTVCSACNGCQIQACYGNETTCDFSANNITCDVYYPSDNCTSAFVDQITTCENCMSCTFNSSNPNSPYENCDNCAFCNAPQCSNVTCSNCNDTHRCFNTDEWQKINDTWGIDIEETLPLLLYIDYTLGQYSKQYLEKMLFKAGGGLFPYRTLDQWVFHAEDPLMLLANPTDPGAGDLIQNQTLAKAQSIPPSTLYTGLQNISQIAQYVTWGNISKIPYPFYASDVEIQGTDEWGQFPPFMEENNVHTLTSWDPNYIRPVTIIKTGEVKYRDVTLWRFMVKNDTLLPNPLYYQSIQGFGNSTAFHYGSPIFYSNPHYAGCDETYANKVVGVVEGRNWESDYTVVDIEPNTGVVMHVNETIQLNVYLDPTIWPERLKIFYPNVTMDVFYPIVWVYEATTMNQENVKEFQAGIIYSRWLQKAVFGIAFGLGVIMLVFSVILILVIKKRNNSLIMRVNSNSVSIINSGYDDEEIVTSQ